jgi:hypothetical protein
MSVLYNAVEVVTGFAVLQSTSLAVLGMVTLLFLYRKMCENTYSNSLKSGEVLTYS